MCKLKKLKEVFTEYEVGGREEGGSEGGGGGREEGGGKLGDWVKENLCVDFRSVLTEDY